MEINRKSNITVKIRFCDVAVACRYPLEFLRCSAVTVMKLGENIASLLLRNQCVISSQVIIATVQSLLPRSLQPLETGQRYVNVNVHFEIWAQNNRSPPMQQLPLSLSSLNNKSLEQYVHCICHCKSYKLICCFYVIVLCSNLYPVR